jgi:hypothetical protein
MKIYVKLKEKGEKTLKLRKKLTAKEAERLFRHDIPRELWLLSSALRICEAVLKVILASVPLVVCLFLISCSTVYGYSEPEDRNTVSALGFDLENGVISVNARIVTEDKSDVKVYSGSGESVEYAMSHIKGADAKQLEMSHLAVIVLGEGVDADTLEDIFDYCKGNDDITVGVRLASAHSAAELLTLNDADGYTLTGALRDGKDGSGFTGVSRFYEVENDRLSGRGRAVCHLPYFSVEGEGYFLDGLKIYVTDGASVRLDRTESAYYMILRDEFSGGPLDFEYEGEAYSAFVSSSKTRCRYDNGRADIVCELELNEELLPRGDTEKIMRSCSKKAEELCRQLLLRYGDVMDIEKRIGVIGVSADMVFVECRKK